MGCKYMKKQIVFSMHEVYEILANYTFDNNLLGEDVEQVDVEVYVGRNVKDSYAIVSE